jgi:hypothetical protein
MSTKTFLTLARIGTVAALLMPVAAMGIVLDPPEPPLEGDAVTATTLETLIGDIVQFLITISVVVAVGFIVWGGIQYVRGKPEDGKTILKNGVIGVAIILGVGLILSTIQRFVLTQSIG